MTSKQFFKSYFRTKLIIWLFVIITMTAIRYFGGHSTTLKDTWFFITLTFVCAVLIGLLDYYFYEKTAPKIIEKFLDKSPLSEFQNIGFIKQDGNQINGEINNYNVTLAPLTNVERNNYLTILIPLQLKEGLDSYFQKFNEIFKLTITDEILFAKAVIKNYDKEYDFNKLLNIIKKTTLNLKASNIEPLQLVDEKYSS